MQADDGTRVRMVDLRFWNKVISRHEPSSNSLVSIVIAILCVKCCHNNSRSHIGPDLSQCPNMPVPYKIDAFDPTGYLITQFAGGDARQYPYSEWSGIQDIDRYLQVDFNDATGCSEPCPPPSTNPTCTCACPSGVTGTRCQSNLSAPHATIVCNFYTTILAVITTTTLAATTVAATTTTLEPTTTTAAPITIATTQATTAAAPAVPTTTTTTPAPGATTVTGRRTKTLPKVI